ncbi:hypothetical protein ES708_12179 [subsurface metagenome]
MFPLYSGKRLKTILGAASIAASPPFISQAPLPYIRPSFISALNGSTIQSSSFCTGTTSVCPLNKIQGALLEPWYLPMTLVNLSSASISWIEKPVRLISPEITCAIWDNPWASPEKLGILTSSWTNLIISSLFLSTSSEMRLTSSIFTPENNHTTTFPLSTTGLSSRKTELCRVTVSVCVLALPILPLKSASWEPKPKTTQPLILSSSII